MTGYPENKNSEKNSIPRVKKILEILNISSGFETFALGVFKSGSQIYPVFF